jgi:hypothetical protein
MLERFKADQCHFVPVNGFFSRPLGRCAMIEIKTPFHPTKETKMKKSDFRLLVTTAALVSMASLHAVQADEQAAIDGCIEQLRVVGGPDGQAGEVVSSEFSEAGTLVMLRDAGGTLWRCLAYSDGTVGDFAMSQGADDGDGAMAGAEPETTTQRVKFDAGTSGTEIAGSLKPGASTRYVLGASNGQNLYVRVADDSGALTYQILNPDGSFLLDQMASAQEYRGQLWQSGDHVVEVINRSGATASYSVIISID